MTRSEFLPRPDAATEEHAALLGQITLALRASGCLVLGEPDAGETPVTMSVDLDYPARIMTLVEVLRAHAIAPSSQEAPLPLFIEPPPQRPRRHSPLHDVPGLHTRLLLAADLERRFFVAANPIDHDTPATFAGRTIAGHHIERILATGWHVWEHDRDDEEAPVEILVGFTPEHFLRYVCFEREAYAEEAGHRHALAERPWSRSDAPDRAG